MNDRRTFLIQHSRSFPQTRRRYSNYPIETVSRTAFYCRRRFPAALDLGNPNPSKKPVQGSSFGHIPKNARTEQIMYSHMTECIGLAQRNVLLIPNF